MEKQIIQFEYDMWEAVLHRDTDTFKKLVSPDAIMICGGYRCLGNEYANLISGFNLSGYTISDMEIINSSDGEVMLHYIIKITAEDEVSKDLEGTFHIVSLWKRLMETWYLAFNMDSRIYRSLKGMDGLG